MALQIALCYANRPAVAHANLGFSLVRELLKQVPDLELDERFDQADKRGERPLRQYDLLLFSLPFEGDYPHLIDMFLRGGIEPLASRRTRGPFVIAGGMAPTLNPEALAEIVDASAMGDAECLIPDIAEKLFPLLRAGSGRDSLLAEAASIQGMYVPSQYHFDFGDDGQISALRSAWDDSSPPIVERRWVKNLDQHASPVNSENEIFAGCAVLEASRGCLWGCRFCAAGFVQRPYRERSAEALWNEVEGAMKQRSRIGLVGADIGDLSHLHDLVEFFARELVFHG